MQGAIISLRTKKFLQPLLPQEVFMIVRKRPVAAGDGRFLYELYCSTRHAEVESFGWDDAMRKQFLHMQWSAQQRSYAMQFPDAEHAVVLCGNVQAGRILVDRGSDSRGLTLVDISLLPEFHNHGIGTRLIRDVQTEAKKACKSIALSVLPANPAIRLYERLGFRPAEHEGYHIKMEWSGAY